jgi:hypothetical protein
VRRTSISNNTLDTLEAYKKKGIRGVWLRIPTTQARYIPEAVDLEFTFHHAEPTYVMMTKVRKNKLDLTFVSGFQN